MIMLYIIMIEVCSLYVYTVTIIMISELIIN